jgi:predicted amidohydrolase YtcJ
MLEDDLVLIQNVELDGQRVDLRVAEKIIEVGSSLTVGDDRVIDAEGGAVLPGLHDHHIHLYATAASAASVSCQPLGVGNVQGLSELLLNAAGTGWIRAVAYHESIAGDIDRSDLDRMCRHRPLRMQHASGKLWILNTTALQLLDLASLGEHAGLERDLRGQLTGRLFRMDDLLRRKLAAVSPPDLTLLSKELASYGVTGVTDASYTNSQVTAEQLSRAHQRDELLQHVYLMGDESLSAGPLKIMLDEDSLPDIDHLTSRIVRAHEAGRGAAFHCVSHIETVFALAGLTAAGSHPADRIEHGAVVRDEVMDQLLASGCTVVTQPGFIADRGERFRRDADLADLSYLYRYESLRAAGVPVAASSDAPYGPLNPWHIMAAAVDRQTESGQTWIDAERVAPSEALRGYLTTPQAPGAAARRLEVGAVANLCILSGQLDAVLNNLAQAQVRFTVAAGRLIYAKDPNTSSVCSPK